MAPYFIFGGKAFTQSFLFGGWGLGKHFLPPPKKLPPFSVLFLIQTCIETSWGLGEAQYIILRHSKNKEYAKRQ